MQSLKLYEIPDAFRRLEADLIDADGELTPELEARLDALEGALERKAAAIAAMIQEHCRTAEAIAAERDRLATRARVHTNTAERLKDYLRAHLLAVGRTKIDAHPFAIAVQRNSSPSIKWEGEGPIPEPWQVVTVSLDYDRARRDAKAGELHPGFSLSYGTHLRIR